MLGDAPGAGPGAGARAAGGGGAGKCPSPVTGDNSGPSAALAAICSADSDELAEGKEELVGVAARVGAGVATGEVAFGRVAFMAGGLAMAGLV